MKEKEKKKHLVAVYGSLRKGLGNHVLLVGAEFLGTFETPPSYTMFSVSGSFPALIKKGATSIIMEAYLVTDLEFESLDRLEGYSEGRDKKLNHYNREQMDTPFGKASWYEYAKDTSHLKEVKTGDWTRFKQSLQYVN